jgi:hypothetical protein
MCKWQRVISRHKGSPRYRIAHGWKNEFGSFKLEALKFLMHFREPRSSLYFIFTHTHIFFFFSYLYVRHGYPWVPTDQGPRGPCQVDPTCQKSCRLASGPRDLIHNPGDPGRSWATLSRSQKTCRACRARFSLDHGGTAASRPEDRGIPSVITEGNLP